MVLFCLGGTTCYCLPTVGLRAMSTYNLIVLGNYSTSSDVELTTIVCDSMSESNSVNFGGQLNASNFAASAYNLQINRNFVAQNGITINAGSVAVGPNPQKTVIETGSNTYTVSGSKIILNDNRVGANVTVDSVLPSRCQNISNGLLALSSQLALLPANNISNPVIVDQQGKRLTFNLNNPDCNGIIVFNLSAESVFNRQNGQIVFSNNTNNIDLVVVNLYGVQVTLGSSVGFPSSWLTTEEGKSKVIWNLYQATGLTISAPLQAALLAPQAVVSGTVSVTMFGVVVLEKFNTQAEVHHPYIIFPPGLTRCE